MPLELLTNSIKSRRQASRLHREGSDQLGDLRVLFLFLVKLFDVVCLSRTNPRV